MVVIARLADLLNANVHGFLDRIENPDYMLAQLIRDMENSLDQARQSGVQAVAAEYRLRRELQTQRSAIAHWTAQARLALDHGRDDLARRALVTKIACEDLVRGLEPQLVDATRVSTEVKNALHAMAVRLSELRQRQTLLAARRQAAEVRLEAQRWSPARGVWNTRVERTERRLHDAEANLLAQLDVSQANDNLELELATLRSAARVEEELANMKRRQGSSE
jgi:phage shock protein A